MKSPDATERLLQQIEWKVLRRLDGLLHGDYRTLFRGAGIDLADIREYQFGDDVRHIEWNATARLGTPHVRQFNEDRDLCAWFLVDTSGSMGFGSNTRRKIDDAIAFVGALAQVLSRHGNRVGLRRLNVGASAEGVIPPGTGRGHVLRMLSSLQKEANQASPQMPEGFSLAAAIAQSAASLRRRSLVFVISDFIADAPWSEALGHLSMRHEVIAVRATDPLESQLPAVGVLTLRDAETGEQVWVDTSDPRFRARFEAVAAEREARIAAAFARAGVDAIELSTAESMIDTLLRFAALRKRLPANIQTRGGRA